MNKSVLIVASMLFAATIVLPVASAEPQCLQVYPWSKLCQGDVGGFLCAMNVCPSAGPAPAPELPHVDCIQVIPWSYLCSGNVRAFVGYYLDMVAVEPGACVLESECFAIEPPVNCLHGVQQCDPDWD